MKLINMIFSVTSSYFVVLGLNIFLSTLFSNTLSICSLRERIGSSFMYRVIIFLDAVDLEK